MSMADPDFYHAEKADYVDVDHVVVEESEEELAFIASPIPLKQSADKSETKQEFLNTKEGERKVKMWYNKIKLRKEEGL